MSSCFPSIRRLFRDCRLLLATTALLTGAKAQIINGDFESSTPFAGWTLEYGTYSNPGSGYQFSGWSFTQPVGHPTPQIWTGGHPFGSAFLSVAPYEGSQMALLNDPSGGQHATRLSQLFWPTAAEAAVARLSVQWGAVLQYAHQNGQPGFSIEVRKNGPTVFTYAVDTNDALAEGWQTTGPLGSSYYYRHGQTEVPLPGLLATDNILVVLTVWDCGDGGHGGFAFFDDVGFPTCTPPPATMVGWWHDATAKDLAGPTPQHGTWVGTPAASSGHVGSSGLNHNGAAYVSVADHAELDFIEGASFSIDLWVKPDSVVTGLQPLVSKVTTRPGGGPHQKGYALYLDDGHPALSLADGNLFWGTTGLQAYVATSVVVPAGEWTFLGVTVDRSSATPQVLFYVNGQPLSESFVPLVTTINSGTPWSWFDPPWFAPVDLRIGAFSDDYKTWAGGSGGPEVSGSGLVFDGETDEVELFRRVLQPGELSQIFAAGTRGKCKGILLGPWTPWENSFGAVQVTGNDALSTPISVPFPIRLGPGDYSTIHISTNGFLYLSNSSSAPGSPNGFGSAATMAAGLRNGPARIAPYWADLDLQPASNAGVYYNTFSNPDRVVITWANAVEAGSPAPKTIQCQLFASGEILFAYANGLAVSSANALCGISSGAGIADPGASDLSQDARGSAAILYENFDATALPFDLAGDGVMLLPSGAGYEAIASPLQSLHVAYGASCSPGMALRADPNALPGAAVNYTTDNLPEVVPGSGIYAGMTVISFGQVPSPGFDLALLGAPGCAALIASLDITISTLGTTPTQTTVLAIPATGASGLTFYVQELALASLANPAGFVTSNAIASTVP